MPFIGSVHLFDWDEINFAECAREMIISGDYLRVQIDFEDFHQKPPLFIWFQVMSMKLFGINEFAARFPNAIAGILNLVLLYLIGKKIRSPKFGLIWALAHGLSFLPFLYFKSGIIDPWFNLFIFSGIILYLFGLEDRKYSWTILSGVCIGLAVLAKGPVGLLLFGATIAISVFSKRLWWALNWRYLISFILPFILVGGFWFLLIIFSGRSEIIVAFIDYQIRLFSTEDAGHGGPFFYHFIVLLIGCFPASIFALKPIFNRKEDFHETAIFWSMLFTLILFSIVETKIVHYSSFCYYGLSFFAAKYLSVKASDRWVRILTTIGSFIWILLLINIAVFGMLMHDLDLAAFIKDPFALANMQAKVNWTYADLLPGLLMLIGVVSYIWKRNQIAFWLSSSLAIYAFLVMIVPKIEAYSQRAAIEYFESIKAKDAEVYPFGYKSYAHLFYSDKRPEEKGSELQYLVTKIQKAEQLESLHPEAIKLQSRDGFLLYELP